MESLLSGFVAMSIWEYIAVFFSLAYVILAIRQSLWCWPAAFVSTLIYTILFWRGALLMESLLNFYYLVMAVYGYWQWIGGNVGQVTEKRIVSWSAKIHARWILAAILLAILIGYLSDTYTDAKLAYLDSFTTVFAIMTTYFVTQKVLENWLYWVVIDIASIYMYWQLGYFPSMVLFILFTVFAIKGFITWQQEFKKLEQEQVPTESVSVS